MSATEIQKTATFDRAILTQALVDSLWKFHPRSLAKSPVMFVVAVGSLISTEAVLADVFRGRFSAFELHITLWLWLTVLCANFAEAIAEGRGKAQAAALRRARRGPDRPCRP